MTEFEKHPGSFLGLAPTVEQAAAGFEEVAVAIKAVAITIADLPRNDGRLIEFPKTWSGEFGPTFPEGWTP